MSRTVAPELLGMVGPFTRIARAMSNEHHVRIVPSGVTCATDGDVIRIPFTADYLPQDKRQLLHGMLDHEVCHVAEERRHKAAKRVTPITILNETEDKRERFLINVVEDVRIEHRYSGLYRGVAENLRALNVNASQEWAGVSAATVGWWRMFCSALNLQAHGLDVPWSKEAEIGEYLALCADELAQMRAGVGPWGEDSRAVAHDIFAKVKDRYEERRREDKKSEEDSDADGDYDGDGMGSAAGDSEDADEGGGPGNVDGDDEDEERAEGDDEKRAKAERDDKRDDKDAKKKAVTPTPGDEPEVEDLVDVVREKLTDYVIHDAKEHARYIPHPKAHALDKVENAKGPAHLYMAARDDVLPQIRVLRQKQLALLSSWARRRVLPGQERGHIDDSALADVRTGATDVFSELTQRRQLNTAVCGLIDCSGSMGPAQSMGTGAYYAMRTAVALAEAWTALGIANEWLGFTAQDYTVTGITAADLKGPYFCRPPLKHLVFKSFDQPLRAARASMGGINGSGSNIDGEAVVWAWQRLNVRPEKRKLLLVISDGQPSTWNGCYTHRELADEAMMQDHLRQAIKTASDSGVEVVGIGAGTDQPKHFFNAETGAKFVHVRSLATLAVDVFKVMSQRMTKLT